MDNLLDRMIRARTVCADHQRRVCPDCQVACRKLYDSAEDKDKKHRPDMNFGEGLEVELEDGEDFYLTEPGRVPFTWSAKDTDDSRIPGVEKPNPEELLPLTTAFGWAPRFIPQFDEQVRGVKVWGLAERGRHVRMKIPIPTHPDKVSTGYCDQCQLTWLRGETSEPFHRHPTHNALDPHDANSHMLDARSIVVHIGADLNDVRKGEGGGVAGLGVYFGEGSKYNVSQPIYLPEESSDQNRGLILAVHFALWVVKERVLPDYMARIEEYNKEGGGKQMTPQTSNDEKSEVEQPVSPRTGLLQATQGECPDRQTEEIDTGKEVEKAPTPKAKATKSKRKAGNKKKGTGKKKGAKAKANSVSPASPEPTEKQEQHPKTLKQYQVEKPFEIAPDEKPARPATPKQWHVERPFELAPEEMEALKEKHPEKYAQPEDLRDNDLRLILATDNRNIVELFANLDSKYHLDESSNGFLRNGKNTKKGGGPLKSSDLLVGYKSTREELVGGGVGVETAWYWVPRKDNVAARGLATSAAVAL